MLSPVMAAALLMELHGALLRDICAAANQDFAGLAVAARACRRAGKLDNQLTKRIVQVDTVCAWLRHANDVKSTLLVQEVRRALRHDTSHHFGKKEGQKFNDECSTTATAGGSGDECPHADVEPLLTDLLGEPADRPVRGHPVQVPLQWSPKCSLVQGALGGDPAWWDDVDLLLSDLLQSASGPGHGRPERSPLLWLPKRSLAQVALRGDPAWWEPGDEKIGEKKRQAAKPGRAKRPTMSTPILPRSGGSSTPRDLLGTGDHLAAVQGELEAMLAGPPPMTPQRHSSMGVPDGRGAEVG